MPAAFTLERASGMVQEVTMVQGIFLSFSSFNRFFAPGIARFLTQAMTQLLGMQVELELIQGVAVDTPALRDQAAKEARQRQAEQLIMNDGLVKSLLEQFPGARVVAGSIRPV